MAAVGLCRSPGTGCRYIRGRVLRAAEGGQGFGCRQGRALLRGHLAGIVVRVLTHGSVFDVPHDGAVPEMVIGRRHLRCGTGAGSGGGNAGEACLRHLNWGGLT